MICYIDEHEVMYNSNTEVFKTPTCSSASCDPEVNVKYTIPIHSILCTEMLISQCVLYVFLNTHYPTEAILARDIKNYQCYTETLP